MFKPFRNRKCVNRIKWFVFTSKKKFWKYSVNWSQNLYIHTYVYLKNSLHDRSLCFAIFTWSQKHMENTAFIFAREQEQMVKNENTTLSVQKCLHLFVICLQACNYPTQCILIYAYVIDAFVTQWYSAYMCTYIICKRKYLSHMCICIFYICHSFIPFLGGCLGASFPWFYNGSYRFCSSWQMWNWFKFGPKLLRSWR